MRREAEKGQMLQKVEKLTETEESLLALAGDLSGAPAERRTAAYLLREHGLPTRRVEAWHYTDLRNRLTRIDSFAGRSATADIESWLAKFPPLRAGAQLHFVNGRLLDEASKLPAGIARSDSRALGFRDATDAVALLHALAGGRGVSLAVSKGAAIDIPVTLAHGADQAGFVSLRHRVAVGEGARASFIEQYFGRPQAITNNVVTDLSIADGATAVWVIAQELPASAAHLAQLNVEIGAGADLLILVLNAGGGLVRQEINVVSKGENSRLRIRGVNLVGGKSHIDVTTSLVHEFANTVSDELFRNVATESGRGVFQGVIKVARAAQKTDARMACNTLLLSDDAEFLAKPELEIFADDVQCGHGATVADILDDHLFYLRARGIPEREARALLVMAFVEEAFDEIDDEELRNALNGRIEAWLNEHG
jgi:Fe-S cluster assembly protein SufD